MTQFRGILALKMLIPHECHKPAFQIDGPIMQQAFIPVARVVKTNKGFGTKGHDEKGHKKRRKFRFLMDDETEFSDEVLESEASTPAFSALLEGLTEAY